MPVDHHWHGIQSKDPENYYGFVYKITHLPTGRYYIGKKAFHIKKTRPPLKGRKRKRVTYIQDWQYYTSSSQELNQLLKTHPKEEFLFQAIALCPDRRSLTYWETHYLFACKALFDERCLNKNILGRFYRNIKLPYQMDT